jgi:antitoxin VapB
MYSSELDIYEQSMAVLIKDEEADHLIRELAQRTGETITDAVKQSVRERLQRVPPSEDEVARRKRRLKELWAYFDSLPRQNEHLTDDEVIGYNDEGHFD